MKEMKPYRSVLLEDLVKMKQTTVKKYVSKHLNNSYEKVHTEDGFVYAEGTYPVLLVAHMDTVHKQCVKKIKYNGSIISSPQGIGGDDRCGIYIILELIKHFKCSVLFTEDEEIGCIGADKFAKSEYPAQCNVNYIIEFDRRGSNDAVFYSCDNPEFIDFCESTDFFKETWGSYSDICEIAPAVGVAAVNLSSGYFQEHTISESINLLAVQRIIEEAKKLLVKDVEKPFEYIETKYSHYGYKGYYDDYYDYGYEEDLFADEYSEFASDENFWLFSKDKSSPKRAFHVYFESILQGEICVEVFAINKMEALGIALAKMSNYCAGDVIAIFDSKEASALG